MQHRHTGRILSRPKGQREALLNGLLSSLVIHGRIETTEAKAKELKRVTDRFMNVAKVAVSEGILGVNARRRLAEDLPATTVKAFVEIAPSFTSRKSGYTRIMKLGNRMGDGAAMAVIEWVKD
jgi:large subunit ribosomal protein L17